MMLRVVTYLTLILSLSGCAPSTADDYLRVSVIHPDQADAAFNAGTALMLEGDPELGAQLLEEAVQLNPAGRDAIFNQGVAYFEMADYPKAAALFRQILIDDPSDADTRYNYELSLFYIQQALPESQQQLTQPEDGAQDPLITPTPAPGGLDGPTPTPPRIEFEPDLTRTPEGGSGDFASDAESTPVQRSGGALDIEMAMQLLSGENIPLIMPFQGGPSGGGDNGEKDW
jgi:tetratricopeptide (TPR) repeat protein